MQCRLFQLTLYQLFRVAEPQFEFGKAGRGAAGLGIYPRRQPAGSAPQRDAAIAAAAFGAGTDSVREKLPNWAWRKGKGTDTAAVRSAMEQYLRAHPQSRAGEAYRAVALDFGIEPRTVRHLAPVKSFRTG